MGACSLLCRRHSSNLHILLHATHHFHIPDYSVFGCRGLVLGKVEVDFMSGVSTTTDTCCFPKGILLYSL